jgi:hypothetical protein
VCTQASCASLYNRAVKPLSRTAFQSLAVNLCSLIDQEVVERITLLYGMLPAAPTLKLQILGAAANLEDASPATRLLGFTTDDDLNALGLATLAGESLPSVIRLIETQCLHNSNVDVLQTLLCRAVYDGWSSCSRGMQLTASVFLSVRLSSQMQLLV